MPGSPPATLHELWYSQATNAEHAAVAPDGTIYFSTGRIEAVAPDGTPKWSFPTYLNPQIDLTNDGCGAPAVGPDGTIYFGTDKHGIVAVTPQGSLKWTYAIAASVSQRPEVAHGTVFAGGDQRVYAVRENGTLAWSAPFPEGQAKRAFAVAADANGTVYAGGAGALVAFSPTGQVAWRAASLPGMFGTPAWFSKPAITHGGNIAATAGQDGVYVFAPNGTQLNRYAIGAGNFGDGARSTAVVAPDNDAVYVIGTDGILYAFANGRVQWSVPVSSDALIAEDQLTIAPSGRIWLSTYGRLRAFDPTNGALAVSYVPPSRGGVTPAAIRLDITALPNGRVLAGSYTGLAALVP